jgi:hypothetical protein
MRRLGALLLVGAGCGAGTAAPRVDAAVVLEGEVRASSSVGLQPPFHDVAARFGARDCTTTVISGCDVVRCLEPRRLPQVADGGAPLDAPPAGLDAQPPPDAGVPDDGGVPAADGGPIADAGPPSSSPGHAGAITVSGGSRIVVLSPDDAGSYPQATSTVTGLWSGGEALRVAAAGGEVPGFSASLVAPREITVVSPALGGGELIFDRDVELGVVWVGGEPGFTVAVAVESDPVSVVCRFPAELGSALLPLLAQRNLPLAGRGRLVITVEDHEIVGPDGWRIDVAAASLASLPDGSAAQVTAIWD